MDDYNISQHQQDSEQQSNTEQILSNQLSKASSELKSAENGLISSKNESPKNQMVEQFQESLPVSSPHNSQSIDMSTDISEFKQFGPANYLLFLFIKKAIILFCILAVLNLILIFYNFAVGETFPVKAAGVGVAFARASLGSFSAGSKDEERTKVLYTTIICLNMIAFFCFWLYWRALSSREAQKIERRLDVSNFCTVVLEGKGIEQATQTQVQEFMRQFAPVREVVRVVDRGEEVRTASQIVLLQQQIHKITNQHEVDHIPKRLSRKLISLYQSIEKLRYELKKSMGRSKGSRNIRFFVKLDSRLNQKKTIQKFKRQKCCCFQAPSFYVLNGEEVNVSRCQPQCWGIYWQNQHTGFKHNIVPNLILLFLVNLIPTAIIIIIGLISAWADPVYYEPSLKSNDLSEALIFLETNRTVIASWCIGNHYSSNMEATCSSIIKSLNERAGIYLAISFCTFLSQYLMKVAILWFSKYFRFKDHAQKSNTVMLHLFVNYAVIHIVIPLAVQANLLQSAMSAVMAKFITMEPLHTRLLQLRQYYDYVPQWYADYGFQLILNYCFIIIMPYSLLPLGHFLYRKLKLIFTYSGEEKKEGELQQFQIEDHIANLFMSIIAGMAFAGGMPIMFPLILLSLLVRYFSIKYLFIYTSKFPKITDRLIAAKIPHLLFIVIVVYVANAIWALGVEQIFTPNKRSFEGIGINENSNAQSLSQILLVFIRRAINNWAIIFVLCLGFLVISQRQRLSNTWLRILILLGLGERQREEGENNLQMQELQDELEMDKSYDPLNNRHYRLIFQQLKN